MASEEQQTGVSDEPQAKIAELTAEKERLETEKSELYDRLLRQQADFENYKRRAERDRSDFIQYAGMELMREILPVLDDFERALKVESADENYARGVEQIYQRLNDTVRKLGLEPIETAGQQFDPHIHQAVEKVHTEEAEDHAVLDEFQKGYHFKGRLLRPSMVKVAVRP